MTAARRITQFGALGLLAALPLIGRGSALLDVYGVGARNVSGLTSPWEAFLYNAHAFLFGWLDDPTRVAELFRGSFWSITVFGYTVNDPLAVLGHVAASGGVHWPLVLGAASPILLAIVAGRAFCGWVCPVNTILEFNAKLRRLIEKRVVRGRLPDIGVGLRPRYLVLGGAIVVSAIASVNAFVFVLPYAGLARDWHLVTYGAGFGAGLLFMVVLLAVELLVAPRIWCRSLCPTGLVLGALGKRRVVGIERKPERSCLSGCKLCVSTCGVGVHPRDGLDTAQCMLCNECVSKCPADVLKLTVSAPRRPKKAVIAAAAIALSLVAFDSGGARAHHVKGLPHYGYVDNYPQTPTIEEQFTVTPYVVTLAAYVLDGLNRKISDTPDDAIIFIALADETTGKPYTGALEILLRPKDGGPSVRVPFRGPIEESVYRLRATLPGDAYDIVISLAGESEPAAVVPLVLKQGANRWLLGSLLVLAATILVIGQRTWRRRKRLRSRGMAHAK